MNPTPSPGPPEARSAGVLDRTPHRVVPALSPGRPTLLMLHGTGGDENDLLGLGRLLAPDAALLSPRGAVLEGGRPRFFRRLAPGVFDQADLALRTDELAGFIDEASQRYGLSSPPVAVGLSNGANIAASLLLRHPQSLAGAVLFRATAPFEPASIEPLSAPVLIAAGTRDPLVRPEETARLSSLLAEAGSRVTISWAEAGHALAESDLKTAADWLAANGFAASGTQDR